MDIDIKLLRNTLVVRLKGELDLAVVDRLRSDIDRRLDENEVKNLIFNMEKVSFVDSSGLGLILGRYKRVSSQGGRMSIVGAKPQVEKVLRFSGINKLVSMYDYEQDVINLQGR